MTQFIKANGQYRLSSDDSFEVYKQLPVGTYTVKFDDFHKQYYLEPIDNFTIGKVYGDATKRAHRILNTFDERHQQTGVLLSGEKGCGKTMLTKLISIEGAKLNIPTLVISEPHLGDTFNKFLQSIDNQCIVLFDEFEKVYDEDQQEKVLTVFDGTYNSKKLYLLTCNDKWRISKHMNNRPGRLFYHLEYRGVSSEFIKEYCADNLKNKAHTDDVVKLGEIFGDFNFDMLKALVEEMNRYNEGVSDAIAMMNIKVEQPDDARFKATVTEIATGIKVPQAYMHFNYSHRFSMSDPFTVELRFIEESDEDDDEFTSAPVATPPGVLTQVGAPRRKNKYLHINPDMMISMYKNTMTYRCDGFEVLVEQVNTKKDFNILKLVA